MNVNLYTPDDVVVVGGIGTSFTNSRVAIS